MRNVSNSNNLLEIPKTNPSRKDSGDVRLNTSRSKKAGNSEANPRRISQ